MKKSFHFFEDGFYAKATQLRKIFDERFENPRKTLPERFVWDHWVVPNQYRLMRTPAQGFFPENLYRDLCKALIEFGQTRLGCQGISPPWISYYVDGCYQNFHGDFPHGPFSYVLSLTDWKKRKFTGGETLLLKPDILNYWTTQTFESGLEVENVVDSIPATFNRLTIFDPRIPHGVARVSGVEDPLQARIVIHGWFTQPLPHVEGALKESQLKKPVGLFLQFVGETISDFGSVHGLWVLRLEVNSNGTVKSVKTVQDTLVAREAPPEDLRAFQRGVLNAVKTLPFPKSKGLSTLILPLVFQ
jgi:hypothetical protein